MVEVVNDIGKMIQTDQWDRKVLSEVGQIAIAHAQLCHQLHLAPKRVKKLPMTEWVKVQEPLSVPKKITELKKAYRERHGSLPHNLTRMLNEIVAVNQDRNGVIHGYWGCTKTDGKITKYHRIWKNKDLGVNVEELHALKIKLRQLRDGLGKFTRQLQRSGS